MLLKRIVMLGALIAATALPAAAAQPMDAMRYYVGTWSCAVNEPGQPTQTATTTYTLDSGILRQWVEMPAQGKMKGPFAFSAAIVWDPKSHRYVQTYLDNEGNSEVEVAPAIAGNVEHWVDAYSNTGKLARMDVTRTGGNGLSVTAYSTKTSLKPSLRVSCKRS